MIASPISRPASAAGSASRRLSPAAARLAALLWQMPLASAADLADVSGGSLSSAYAALQELESLELAGSAPLGASCRVVRRYWPQAPDDASVPPDCSYYLTRAARRNLLARLPVLEWFYRIPGYLSRQSSTSPMTAFAWHTDYPCDAAVQFDQGWAALFYAGVWQDAPALRQRLARLGPDLADSAADGGPSWPGLFVFVVPDAWQSDLTQEVVAEFGLQHNSIICDVSRELVFGTVNWGLSRGWPRRRKYYSVTAADTRGWPDFLRRAGQTNANSRGGLVSRILAFLEQWPGASYSQLRRLLGGSGSAVSIVLDNMLAADLLVKVRRGYYPTRSSLLRAARRDRVHHRLPQSRLGKPAAQLRLQRHDQGVIRLIQSFADAGCPVAPGGRAIDDAGPQGKLNPDAVIRVASPHGFGWHYLEYERRARSPATLAHKLRSYLMPARVNDWPILFVVDKPAAEPLLWEVGRGLPLLTTTAERAFAEPPVDNPGVWSSFGVPATLRRDPADRDRPSAAKP